MEGITVNQEEARPAGRITAHIDLNDVESRAISRILHGYELAGMALATVDRLADDDLPEPILPESLWQLDFPHRPPAERRSVFRRWTVGCGLRDSIEATHALLNEVRRLCGFYSFARRGGCYAEEWIAEEDACSQFERLGLLKQVRKLRSEFGFTPPDEATADILSINSARNCLVHRGGIVGPEDLNGGEQMEVGWRCIEVQVRGSSSVRVVERPHEPVEAGESVAFVVARKSKRFGLHDRLDFTNQEYAAITFFLIDYVRTLVRLFRTWSAEHPTSGASLPPPLRDARTPWPHSVAERLTAVLAFATRKGAAVDLHTVVRGYAGASTRDVQDVLAALEALGHLIAISEEPKQWKAAR